MKTNKVTSEMVIQKMDELITMLQYAEAPGAMVTGVAYWRMTRKGAVLMRDFWDEYVIHYEEKTRSLMASVLGEE